MSMQLLGSGWHLDRFLTEVCLPAACVIAVLVPLRGLAVRRGHARRAVSRPRQSRNPRPL
jgi:hypothetical protein